MAFVLIQPRDMGSNPITLPKESKMSKKLPLRHEREWRWKDPPKFESGFYNHRIELLNSASQRMNHFPGYGRDSFYEDEDDYDIDYVPESVPEYCGTMGNREAICLTDVLKQVEKYGLDPKKVYFTASFAEDYLCVEVVHIRELDEQGQLEEYQEALSKRSKTKKDLVAEERKRLQHEIESLQKRLELLKKKQ